MKRVWRTILLLGALLGLSGMFLFVMMRSGPLAPVPVTTTDVEARSISPALYGIGVVESGMVYRVGPTSPGRVGEVFVEVGDFVAAGKVVAVMDPVDLDQRINAQGATVRRLEAAVKASSSRTAETEARKEYAAAQSKRYANLLKAGAVSVDAAEAKEQERQVTASAWTSALADLQGSKAELERAKADLNALASQKGNLDLIAPGPGLVTARAAERGSTAVAGQAVVEIVDTGAIRVSVRFDQSMASGLKAGLPAEISLRSGNGRSLKGRILRVEPVADPVTEEIVAKAVFDTLPDSLPPLGELAEVTVHLPSLPSGPVIPDSALHRYDGRLGVWVFDDGAIAFRPVKAGRRDLEGRVQVLEGLEAGEKIVVYSLKALTAKSRVKVYETLEEMRP